MSALANFNGGTNSVAFSINDAGTAVGWATDSDGVRHAVAWDAGGIFPRPFLGALAQWDGSEAQDINSQGQIVGFGLVESSEQAFLYDPVLGARSLSDTIGPSAAGWSFYRAQGINDSGQIAGYGLINGEIHGFVASPVPEPASLLALLLAARSSPPEGAKRRHKLHACQGRSMVHRHWMDGLHVLGSRHMKRISKTIAVCSALLCISSASAQNSLLEGIMREHNISATEAAAGILVGSALGLDLDFLVDQGHRHHQSITIIGPALIISRDTGHDLAYVLRHKPKGKGWGQVAKEMGMHPGTFNKMRKQGVSFESMVWMQMLGDKYHFSDRDYKRYRKDGLTDIELVLAVVMSEGKSGPMGRAAKKIKANRPKKSGGGPSKGKGKGGGRGKGGGF